MAKPEIPNGDNWKDNQHVVMAINIKSMNDFELADGATPVFYGSAKLFTLMVPQKNDTHISITGTNIKAYGGIIRTDTPILLLTRVRDITDDIDNLDKRYIVCSHVEINTDTIIATITDKVYETWNSLPELTKYYMNKYDYIFERRKKDNDLRKEIIENAINSTNNRFSAKAPANIAKQLAVEQSMKEAESNAARLVKEAIDTKTVMDARMNERKLAKQERPKINEKRLADESRISAQAKKDAAFRVDRRSVWKGGSLTNHSAELTYIISNENINFKQYIYFLLMQPFYFKMNALTPISLNNIKNYKLIGGSSTGTFNTYILQPFVKFSYVKYIDTITNEDALNNHLSELIEHQKHTPITNFANQIIKDTKNYQQLNDSYRVGYYIHIFRFIELIEKTLKRYPTNGSPLPGNVNVFIKYALENIHVHMMYVKPLFDLLTSVDMILIRDSDETQRTNIEKPLHIYIDDYVSSQTRTDVITYLKITNTEPAELIDNHSWNQRYDIRLKQAYMARDSKSKFNAMILGYKSVPLPFYKQITDEHMEKRIVAVDELDDIVTYKTPKITYNEIDKIKKYDNYYMFGNYENIFPLYNIDGTKETNLENASNMTAIIEQICTHKKPVFLLGYGSSGSGKTSSLIYFNKGKTPDEQNGIVIHLCEKIIEKLQATDQSQVKSVKVVVKEFYTTTALQTNQSAEYIFTTDLKLISGNISKPNHAYHVNMNKPVDKFETMGQVLKQLVDVDRYVKATTNNQQSSRSHVLVFIQYCSDDTGNVPVGNLIIGDFAGKENEFQCADTDTVVAFLNKKVENKEIVEILNSKQQPNNVKPEMYTFYGAQLMQNGGDGYANDPINELVSVVDNKTLTQEELDKRNVLQTASMLFDFEKPSNSINKADINNPDKYDLFKLIADQYAPIVIKYYFKDEQVPTSVQPLNNSKIYDKLLNGNDNYGINDKGIDIFNIYTKTAVSDDKRARFLQHLIFEDLFEANPLSNVITDADINKYKYDEKTNDTPVEVPLINEALLALSQKLLIVPGNQVSPTYILGKKMYKIIEDLTANHGVLIDQNFYIGNPHISSGKRDAEFKSVINMINTYKTQISTNVKPNVKQIPPYTPTFFTIDVMKKSFIDVFDKSMTRWVIALNKTVPYTDNLDRDREKAIPIVKSFTISTMCKYFMTNRFKSLLPFFKEKQSRTPNKPKQPSTDIFYEKNVHNYVNEFKYILDSVNSPDNELADYIKLVDIYQKNITITQVRLKHGKQVCENRLIEGKYINSSLDKVREAIKYILNKKHEKSDSLFHSPDFIDICLQSYCPAGINCFNTSASVNAPESLIDEIYKHLYPVPNDDTNNKFYTDVVISVLCVFNVSRLADNPPQVPYIDINHLKQIYYNKDSEYSQKYPLLWALHNLKIQIDDLKLEHNPRFYAGLNTLIKSALDHYAQNPENVLTITSVPSGAFMFNLKKMVDAIDIHNAASTIGTLEFLDQLSKFNSVNNLCYTNKDSHSTPYLDDSEYKTYADSAIAPK
jgi:hypothetical protein